MSGIEHDRWASPQHGDVLWMEDMLSYCANLLSQIRDLSVKNLNDSKDGFVEYPVATGPSDAPDSYGITELLDEIHTRRPQY